MILHFDKKENINKNFVTFQNDILYKEPFLLVVTAEWCGFCQRLKPTLAELYKTTPENRNIITISEEVQTHLSQHHPSHEVSQILSKVVSGYPSILYVEQKKSSGLNIHEFDEERTINGLRKFQDKHEKISKQTAVKTKSPNPKSKSKSTSKKSPKKPTAKNTK